MCTRVAAAMCTQTNNHRDRETQFSPPLSLSLSTCRYVVDKEEDAISPKKRGTKVAPYYVLTVPGGEERTVQMRITDADSLPSGEPFGVEFDETFRERLEEADDFYDRIIPKTFGPNQRMVSRQAYAGGWGLEAGL